MENSISHRIELIMNEFNLNKNSFSKAIGLKNNVTIGRIINENRKPSYDILTSITQTFGSINARWLLTGDGNMIEEKNNENQNSSLDFEHYEKLIERQETLLKNTTEMNKFLIDENKRLSNENNRLTKFLEIQTKRFEKRKKGRISCYFLYITNCN